MHAVPVLAGQSAETRAMRDAGVVDEAVHLGAGAARRARAVQSSSDATSSRRYRMPVPSKALGTCSARSVAMTRAPSSCSRSASAAPCPAAAPVTTISRPVSDEASADHALRAPGRVQLRVDDARSLGEDAAHPGVLGISIVHRMPPQCVDDGSGVEGRRQDPDAGHLLCGQRRQSGLQQAEPVRAENEVGEGEEALDDDLDTRLDSELLELTRGRRERRARLVGEDPRQLGRGGPS